MDFPGFYRNHICAYLILIPAMIKDKRFRWSLLFLISGILALSIMVLIHWVYRSNLETDLATLKAHTQALKHRIETRQHYAHIPQFKTAITTLGGYTPPLSETACLSNMSGCFLQTTKPEISAEITKQDIQPSQSLQAVEIQFKSSFDYELFDMMAYILSTPNFGYTRLRSFEIEQLFETSPQIKGRFVYDQLSLIP